MIYAVSESAQSLSETAFLLQNPLNFSENKLNCINNMDTKKETIIISLGGSLMAPNDIDLGFLKNFRHSLQKYLGPKRFFILVGGGKVCRVYQNALLEFGAKSNDRDWMGINVSRLNAEIVKQSFAGYAFDKIVTDPTKKIKTNKDIVIGAGYKPGWSTDYVSVLTAKNYGVKTIINLTNIDYVYDQKPKRISGS